MSIRNTVSYRGVDPASGKVFSVRGTGDTRAEALAEAQAKLGLTVMDVQTGQESQALPDTDFADSVPATGLSADGVIVLTKGIGFSDKTVRFENMTVDVKKAGTKGKIDGSHLLITNFATKYRDGDGEGGYIFLDGDLYP